MTRSRVLLVVGCFLAGLGASLATANTALTLSGFGGPGATALIVLGVVALVVSWAMVRASGRS